MIVFMYGTEFAVVSEAGCKVIWIRRPFLSVVFNNLRNRELEESHEEWSSHKIVFRNSVIRSLGRSLEVSRQEIYQDRRKLFCTWLINWLFWHSAERNSVQLTRFIYLLARRFYIVPDVLLFLYLSITAYSFSLKAYFSKALYLFVWWSLIIGLHIMRRMYLPTKTSHKTLS